MSKTILYRGAVYRRADTFDSSELIHEAWGDVDAHGGGFGSYVVSYDPKLGDPVDQGIQGNKSRRVDKFLGEFATEEEARMTADQWEREQWHKHKQETEDFYDAVDHRHFETQYSPKPRELRQQQRRRRHIVDLD